MRRRLRATMTLLAATAALLVAPSAPAHAGPADQWGFAYVNQPANAALHTLPLSHQAGDWAAGSVVTGRKINVGRFEMRFPFGAIGSRGIPHVTAVGPNSNGTPNYCHVMSWSNGVVVVQCQRPGGVSEDTRFTVMWTRGSGAAMDGRAHSYCAHIINSQSYSSIPGGSCTVAGTNPYLVRFMGAGAPNMLAGNIQVTAVYPENSPRRCKVLSWGGTIDVSAYVACYDAVGNVVPNTPFTVSYNRLRSVYGGTPRHFGYLWCPNGGFTTFNSSGVPNTCTQLAIGRYQTVFPNLAQSAAGPTHTQVTAQGQGSTYCTITQLWPVGPDGRPQVDCYTNAGARTNHNFLIAFTGAH